MAGQRIENERARSGQHGLRVTERKERSDAPSFPSLAGDLDRKLNDRFQVLFLAARQLRADRLENRHRFGMWVVMNIGGAWRNPGRRNAPVATVIDEVLVIGHVFRLRSGVWVQLARPI